MHTTLILRCNDEQSARLSAAELRRIPGMEPAFVRFSDSTVEIGLHNPLIAGIARLLSVITNGVAAAARRLSERSEHPMAAR